MIPQITEVSCVRDFVLHLRFSDGIEGDVDLGGRIEGEVFAPLRDPTFFRQVSVHPELHTVVWPNGADLAPEFLYEQVQVSA